MTDLTPGENWREETYQDSDLRRVSYRLILSIVLVGILVLLGSRFFAGENSYIVNLYTSVLSIVVTIGALDALNERCAIQLEKQRLIHQMGSPIREFAVEATRILRLHRWGFGEDKTLEKAMLPNANLEGAHLSWCNLEGAYLGGVILNQAIIDYSNLKDTILSEAQLRSSRLDGVTLENARLNRADFRGASFGAYEPEEIAADFMLRLDDVGIENLKKEGGRLTNFRNADLSDANLEGTWFGNVDLEGADLVSANLKGLFGNKRGRSH